MINSKISISYRKLCAYDTCVNTCKPDDGPNGFCPLGQYKYKCPDGEYVCSELGTNWMSKCNPTGPTGQTGQTGQTGLHKPIEIYMSKINRQKF